MHPETNRNRIRLARPWLSLIALSIATDNIGAVPIDGSHQIPSQQGRQRATIEVKQGFTGLAPHLAVNMGTKGKDSLIIWLKAFNHGGPTYCAARCETSPPGHSTDYKIDTGAQWTVHGDWAAPAGTTIYIKLSDGAETPRLPGRVEVTGTLTADATGITFSFIGTPPTLPFTVLSARQITGPIKPGILPPGTRISVTGTTIQLIRSK